MGLVLKLKKNQRVFFDEVMIEIDYCRGQIKLYVESPKPYPFKITREDIQDYKDRVSDTYNGGENENGVYNLQSLGESATSF